MGKRPAKSTKPAPPQPPQFSMELWESMWRVVDASRLAIRQYGNTTHEDALSFLADQEKMLRRCLGGDAGEVEMRVGVTKHPFVLATEEAEELRVETILKERESP